MRHLRMVGLCLVAVFAIAAVAATSASALPEWGKCEKLGTKTGAYTDANCTKKAKPLNTGEFKFIKGKELKNVKFSGNNVGAGGVLNTELKFCEGGEANPGITETRISKHKCEAEGGTITAALGENLAVECEAEHNNGEVHSTNQVVNVTVKFTGCKVFGSVPCSNGAEGEIKVNPLKGNLGYISKSEHKVGLLLTPAKAKGEFAKFSCLGGALTTVVGVGNEKEGAWYEPEKTGGYDGIISPIEPVNQMTTKYTQVFAANAATHENIPSKFEGKHIELLEDYVFNAEEPEHHTTMWSPADEEITNENTAEEAGMIKG